MEQQVLNRAVVHVLAMQQYQIRALQQTVCRLAKLPVDQVQRTMRETWTLEGRQVADALWRRIERELASTAPEELNLADLLEAGAR
jgi:hypothetical protein